MPAVNTLDWSDASANGDFFLGTEENGTGVTIATTTASNGDTAEVNALTPPGDAPTTEALWVNAVEEPVTTTLDFDDPVADVSFEIFDVDQYDGWDDQVTVLAYDAEGNLIEVDFTDLAAHHSVSGNTLDANGSVTPYVETQGGGDSVTVSIPGPVSRIEIIFDNGETNDSSGVIGVGDIQFAMASDGIVQGTAAADLIDTTYIDATDGDQITEDADSIVAGDGDDTIISGAGNDSINAGEGNDSIIAGAGNDSVEMEAGNDIFYGGAGDDSVNGNLGSDTLHGGEGSDFLRGSYGNDTIYSGGTGEGDDYLWGGFGDDRFIIQEGFGNDTIAGEDVEEVDGDTIDMSAVTSDLTLDLSNSNSKVGTFSDGTSTAEFSEIENIILGAGEDTIVLADTSGSDAVIEFTVPTLAEDGTFGPGDRLDVSALTNDGGTTPVTVEDVTVTEDSDGNAVLTFPGGEALTLVGVSAASVSDPATLMAMGLPQPPDGTVSGTNAAEHIGLEYVDHDGDKVDEGDARLEGYAGDDDLIEAGGGNDTVYSGQGDDRVRGQGGDDHIFGGAGGDRLFGNAGNDSLFGEAGDDRLFGGQGDDSLYGGDGNDTLNGSDGADVLYGDADRDTFINITDGDQISGGEAGDDYDVMDLSGAGPLRIHYNEGTTEDGRVDFLDEEGNVSGSMTFEGIEHIVPCFTPGTLVATVDGLRNVETLDVGDNIFTKDHGVKEIKWIGHKTVNAEAMQEASFLAPIEIKQGALGNNLPDCDMQLSPNHRVLVSAPDLEMMFGQSEVLVAAKHLVGLKGISRAEPQDITYIHIMFDRHEIIWSDGIWSESFQPGATVLNGMDSAQRDEIFCLFPELATQKSNAFRAARRILRKHEVALLPQGQS